MALKTLKTTVKASGGTKSPSRRLCADDAPIIPPPSQLSVDCDRKVVLFTHDGQPMARKIGY